jgi:Protein of unknown function (DUF3050)
VSRADRIFHSIQWNIPLPRERRDFSVWLEASSGRSALKEVGVPPGITHFVRGTLQCAIHGCVVEVGSDFFLAVRMYFPKCSSGCSASGSMSGRVPVLCLLRERHIELDGDSHGPWAREMLMTLAKHDESSWQQATRAAERAITSCIKLWDRVQTHLKTGSNSASNGLAAGSRAFL